MKKIRYILFSLAFVFLLILPLKVMAEEEGASSAQTGQEGAGEVGQNPSREKNFTLKKVSKDPAASEESVGDYATLREVIQEISKENDAQYVIYLNQNATMEDTETRYTTNLPHVRLTSGDGGPYTLTIKGGPPLIQVAGKTDFEIDHIVLDGNKESGLINVSGGVVTFGDGAVIQNFRPVTHYHLRGFIISTSRGKIVFKEGSLVKDNVFDADANKAIIYVGTNKEDKGTLEIQGGTFKDNTNSKYGGVIVSWGDVKISGGSFKNNKADLSGGALAAYGGSVEITGGTFQKNSAPYGGAIAVGDSASLKIQGTEVEPVQFLENEATKIGGAIYCQKGSLHLEGALFSKNKAQTGGGAVSIFNSDPATISNTSFQENTLESENGWGGAIYVSKDSKLTVQASSFEKNHASIGGAIATSSSTGDDPTASALTITKSKFHQNDAYQGGGVFTAFPTTIEDTQFIRNAAKLAEKDDDKNPHSSGTGGAIYVMDQATQIKGSTFEGNSAYGSGGALAISGLNRDQEGNITGKKPNIKVTISQGSKFSKNQAQVGQGGAIYTIPYEYEYEITDKDAYQNLMTDKSTIFVGNQAIAGKFLPPKNYDTFTDLQFSTASDVSKEPKRYQSLLNNNDINYKSDHRAITYDANGGKFDDASTVQTEDYEVNTEITFRQAPSRSGYRFVAWNTKADGRGTDYQPGAKYTLTEDLILYAKWRKPTPTPTPTPQPEKPVVTIIEGPARQDTAVQVSKDYFPEASRVIIVQDLAYPDSMSAMNVSRGRYPILYVGQDVLYQVTREEILRTPRKEIIVVGGENTISKRLFEEIKALNHGKVTRMDGLDRFGTNRKSLDYFGPTKKAVLASGMLYADALSSAPYAHQEGAPILLVRKDAVPKDIKEVLEEKIEEAILVGGPNTVSAQAKAEAEALIGQRMERISGSDRYVVSTEVAKRIRKPNRAILTSGELWADALTSGPLAQKYTAPILLAKKSEIPLPVIDYLQGISSWKKVFLVGGPNSLSQEVYQSLRAVIKAK